MADKWFILRDDKKYGPYTSAQMKTMAGGGQLLPIDMVLEEGTPAWLPASQVGTFFPASGSAPLPPPLASTPPPMPPPLATEPAEWHFTQNGQQAGPVPWSQLRQLAASGQLQATDMLWKAGMPAWAAASTVQHLFPSPSAVPPPLPPALPVASISTLPSASAPVVANRVTGEIIFQGVGGNAGAFDEIKVILDGEIIGTGSITGGIQFLFETTLGNHRLDLKYEDHYDKQRFPLKLLKVGHYSISLSRAKPTSTWGAFKQAWSDAAIRSLPTEIEISHNPEPMQVQFALISTQRTSNLVGLWEPASGNGLSFIFTKDGAMYRSDGLSKKYRWLSKDKLELSEDDPGKTVQCEVLSVGKQELILKTEDGTGHYKRGKTITEAKRKKQGEMDLWSMWQRSARQKKLIGLWEPVNFTSLWFMFTKDEAMLRGDGLALKYRWAGDDTLELYADETDKTVDFTVLSLNEFEMILKVGEQSGHFKKGVSITEAETQKREAQARKRRAEAAQNFKNLAFGVASVLAAGGLAVLCGGLAVAAVASAESGGRGSGGNMVACWLCNQTGRALSGDSCQRCGGRGWLLAD